MPNKSGAVTILRRIHVQDSDAEGQRRDLRRRAEGSPKRWLAGTKPLNVPTVLLVIQERSFTVYNGSTMQLNMCCDALVKRKPQWSAVVRKCYHQEACSGM